MMAQTRLQQLKRAVQRRRIGLVLAFFLPWWLVACALAWRWQGGVAWLLPAMVAGATIAFATRYANAIDAQWLSRALDLQRRDLEDSTALLFADADTLPPLAHLQRLRLERRIASEPAPDLRPRWPLRHIAGNALLAMLMGSAALWWRPTAPEFAPSTQTAAEPAEKIGDTRIVRQQIDIQPPAYTGLPARQEASLQVKVPEGSTLSWTLRFAPQPESAELLFHDGTRLPLQRDGEDWTAARKVEKSSLYRLSLGSTRPISGRRLHRIDVVADQPPQVRVTEPDRSLTVLETKQARWALAFEASDDFGLGAAQLRITLAQGTGENISVSARTLQLSGTGDARRRTYRQSLDLAALGFAVGDDLVVRLAVSDKRTPTAQTTRSASFILRWPPETGAEATGVEGMVKRTLPAYFRSQRQIIIDSEALLKQRGKLTREEFVKHADEIGVDQRILRLRYGQFLGEESEGGAKPPPTGDGAKTSATAPTDEHDDGEPASEKPTVTGDATAVLKEYGHTHDQPEAATLLDPETRLLLKSALDQMWQAELHLRQGHPDLALPYEYRALRFIKQVQQASRIYLARVGLELPPIDESRRLSGDRTGLQSRRDALTPAQVEASPVLQLWQALDEGRAGATAVELDAFERWLRTRESELPDALDLYAAVDELRRAPSCVSCAEKLRSRLWPLLAAPAPAVDVRRESDRTGRAYLDALQASPSSETPP